jgi:hypothetical protein
MSSNTYPRPYTYQITFIPTQQSYIGVRTANNVLASDDFWHIYFSSSKKVQSLIDAHGKEAFRIDWIKEYETREEAVAAEMILLKENDVVHNDHYLNKSAFPNCDMTGYKHTPEQNKKKSERMMGRTSTRNGPLTEEHKRNISKAKKGKAQPWNTHNKGRKHTPEARENMSKAKLGKKRGPYTEEHKRALRNAWVKRRIRAFDCQEWSERFRD